MQHDNEMENIRYIFCTKKIKIIFYRKACFAFIALGIHARRRVQKEGGRSYIVVVCWVVVGLMVVAMCSLLFALLPLGLHHALEFICQPNEPLLKTFSGLCTR